MKDRQQFGQSGERLAVRHLRQNGYRILERNYRNHLGEIDIIAKHEGAVVFVEVKARRTGGFGHPKWAVTFQKQQRISKVALSYLKETGQLRAKARFDVVAILQGSPLPEIEIVRNAFELAYP